MVRHGKFGWCWGCGIGCDWKERLGWGGVGDGGGLGLRAFWLFWFLVFPDDGFDFTWSPFGNTWGKRNR